MQYRIFIAFIFFLTSSPPAQTLWHKHPSNPIFSTGNQTLWDGSAVYSPSVIFDGSIYKMYYAGNDGVHYQIGLATSDDKINWARFNFVPVLETGSGWDSYHVTQPSVLLIEGIYHLWYTGFSGGGVENLKIGYAISNNGTGWDKYDFNPVFAASTIGNWDPLGVSSPSVIKIAGYYYMWFTGHGENDKAIGLATSSDGINWNWYEGNPVLIGNPAGWDKEATNCKVLKIGGNFLMFYVGFNGDSANIGYAHSYDGINWDKYSSNPVLRTEVNSWEQLAVDEPDVYWSDGNQLEMWYSGFDNLTHSQIGYANEIIIGVDEPEMLLPTAFSLEQNFPNPFNPSTKIKFNIPREAGSERQEVTIKVYDILGNDIATLVNEEKPAGTHGIVFDADTYNLPSSVYFYKLLAGEFYETKKMLLLK